MFRVGYPERRVRDPPYPRESATLQSIEADAYPDEGSQGTHPVADFRLHYDAQQAAM